MTVNPETETQVEQLRGWYGDGRDGTCPTSDQWRGVLERSPASPITLINFFKLRPVADYPDNSAEASNGLSGQAAFDRYAEVSVPAMQRAGGRFLLVGPFEGSFLGTPEDWDLVAVGSYPNTRAFLALYTDPDYRAAFRHRTAACARQKVMVCSG
ncbi:MAG: DUF1330 domain-containing protein [Thalassobaculum sp.]|uniref:DUF1330 domain-containing protein n=1 Tax=Thalassobaculum sp. TaxID=2022740 RepID=UPI0032F022B8